MKTLILVSVGPVQEFIERARRTRDLWFGSHVLSEMARGVARALSKDWRLVFPALDAGSPELALCSGMWRTREGQPNVAFPPVAVSNKVLAVREGHVTDVDCEVAAGRARDEAIAVWQHFARRAEERAGPLLRGGLRLVQTPAGVIDDLLEFVVAWRRFEEGGYADALGLAEAALDERKRLRDFEGWSGSALPKSSLDGHRETILAEGAPRSGKVMRRYRIGAGEHLDGVGVVKRMGGDPEQFVPVARVALAPWIRAIEDRTAGDRALAGRWSALRKACRDADVTECSTHAASWLGGSFPYDAEVFFESRWRSLDFFEPKEGEAFGRANVAPVLRALGRSAEPYPYVACLSADGDRMGEALRGLTDEAQHRALSRALGDFARRVRAEVGEHLGVTLYAGGDDLLALVPVERAVPCALALQRAFVEATRGVLDGASLSVGVAVSHVLTALGEILGRAREALRLAKNGPPCDELPDAGSRRALGVIVDKRSGGRRSWRCPWDDDPNARLLPLVEGFAAGRVPGGLPYEVERFLDRLPPLNNGLAHDLGWASLARGEVRSILRRKGAPDRDDVRGIRPEEVDLVLDDDARYEATVDALRAWVDRCCIAREIARAKAATVRVRATGKGEAS